jgi:alkylation response protein AidB-like acyl-CoA dehydrogenase
VLIFEALQPAPRYVALALRRGLVSLWFSRKPFPHLVVLQVQLIFSRLASVLHLRIPIAFLLRDSAYILRSQISTVQREDAMQVAMMPISESLFQDCAERAPIYDRENRFFAEDFEDLRVAGYLLMPVPSELGGWGMTLPEVCREQRRLAYHAPATALGLNMHLYWMGIAADLRRAGDPTLEWMLREAAAGEVFAAGHAETGNDIPVLLSTTKAERVDGGYRFYGRKHFGSLSPVWTRLGLHGMDTSDPAAAKIVHAFLPRQTPGYRIEETWDVLGMRSTRSDDTILEGCFVPFLCGP